MNYVLDACAILAYLRREPGGEIVWNMVRNSENRVSIHSLNICEVFYDVARTDGEVVADDLIRDVMSYGIKIREDADNRMWRFAGSLKTHYRLSLADAFGISLAIRMGASFVTSDHCELDLLAEDRVCNILFIR